MTVHKAYRDYYLGVLFGSGEQALYRLANDFDLGRAENTFFPFVRVLKQELDGK